MLLAATNRRSSPLQALALMVFLFHFLPGVSHAQKKETYKGIGFNKDKIELLYQDVDYTSTYSSGRTYSGTYKAPLLRINGGEPMDYDPYKLLPFMKECPSAKKEILAYNSTRKKSKESFIKGFLLGGAVAVAGVIGAGVASEKNEKLALPIFAVSFGTGLGLMTHGVIKSRKNYKKSLTHLENSVVFYNQKCYQAPAPAKVDSAAAEVPPLTNIDAPKNDGVVENYQDTFYYKLLRNNPAGSHFISGGLHIMDLDIANFHGFSYWVGADLYYQRSSKFAIEGMYRTALLDNFSEDSSKGSYIVDDDIIESGESADYQRAREIAVLTTIEFAHKNRKRSEKVYIGKKTIGGAPVEQYGSIDVQQRVSWAARAGATDFNAVWFAVNGLPFATSELPAPYIDPNTGEVYQSEYDLSSALVMVHSVSVSAGISRRVISDLEMDILKPKKKTKRESVGVNEWYADLVYAPKITTGEVYQVTENPLTGDKTISQLQTDQTTVNNIGWRAGFRSVHTGGFALGVEAGMRPGPDAYRGYLMLTGQFRLGKSLQ